MTETTGMELVLPHSGEIIDPGDVERIAQAYAEVQRMEGDLNRAKRALAEALRDHSSVVGARTFTIGSHRVVIEGGTRTSYDAELLERLLRNADMPEATIREIITEEVTAKVDARRLKQAARVNESYASAMELAATTVDVTPRVNVT